MANLKASQKSIRKTERQTERNRQVRSRLKTLAKKVQTLADSGDAAAIKAAGAEYISALDKAAKRNVIHPNKASRHKQSLSKYVFAA